MSDDQGIMEFETGPESIPFKIRDQDYTAHGVLPAEVFGDFIAAVGRLGEGDDPDAEEPAEPTKQSIAETAEQMRETTAALRDAIVICCPDETAERLVAGLRKGAEHPIPLKTLSEILRWLLKEYGLSDGTDTDGGDDQEAGVSPQDRPTQPTSDSPGTTSGTPDGSAVNSSDAEDPAPSLDLGTTTSSTS